ncbi:GlcG/HbpS family heme-binding protein [Sphingomonas sp. Root710]|uniref:GlcG/HbpS family heme-binding protein n=1 Tax=Sphingomonas sp. Root710 TaxID=1736594 RepID=UPI001F1B5742|nr:heme-binding protein [Sphingomonas sp. Root710]
MAIQAIQAIMEAAILCAADMGVTVSVAIVDTAGNLAGFGRMPGSFLISIDLSIDKAWTAASFGVATRELSEMLEREPRAVREGLLRRPRLTEVPGGMPILVDELVVGAIGVSGASDKQDERCAAAGLSILGR